MDSDVFFGSVQAALQIDRKPISLNVVVSGQELDHAYEVRTSHAHNQPVGTLEFVVDADVELALGSTVQVQAGYGAPVGTIFNGFIPDEGYAMTQEGWYTRYKAVGFANRLNPPVRNKIVFPGLTTLKDIFVSFCNMRGAPNYYADPITITNSDALIAFGNIPELDEGKFVIPKGTSPLQWLNNIANLFYYYVFDTPQGILRFQRILNPPLPGTTVASYVEGEHVLSMGISRESSSIINDTEVRGASYTAADGSTVAIRTFPLTVPDEPLLAPLKYQHQEIQNELLQTLELAEGVRQAQDIAVGTLSPDWSWGVEGDPERAPGDPVFVRSEKKNREANVWITSIQQGVSEEGYWADMTGWAGNGVALAPGDDCIPITLLVGAKHLGNEYLPNYKINGYQGIEHKVTFTVPADYSSLKIVGFAHGTNSFARGQESTASRFEIWQGTPLEKVAEGELPRQLESLKIDYDIDANWPSVVIPLTGSIKEGTAELRILSGVDSTVGDRDDFEVRDLKLIACGVGQPIYPTLE